MIQRGKVQNFLLLFLCILLSTRGFTFSQLIGNIIVFMVSYLGDLSTIAVFKCKDNKFIFFFG